MLQGREKIILSNNFILQEYIFHINIPHEFKKKFIISYEIFHMNIRMYCNSSKVTYVGYAVQKNAT